MIRQVKVVTHQPQWRNAFKIESHSVSQAFGGNVSAIHHIGSTAILNIYAKPIIDLLIVDRCTKFREIDAIQLLIQKRNQVKLKNAWLRNRPRSI